MERETAELAPDDDHLWQRWSDEWSLRPGVTYLNHGSFGPAPRPVLEARRRWFDQLESEPMDFLVRVMERELAAVCARLATLVHAEADHLVLVDNATTGMNIVANGFPLRPGDEVLATDHEYGAVLRIWQRACDRAGAKLVVRQLPCPIDSAEEVVGSILDGATDRTRLLVASHITSSTAVVLPVQAICAAARRRGIPVCIDGPHAPGVAAIDLAALDCDYYAASCHKWLCAPIGSGFLYVHPRARATVQPAVVSWGVSPSGQAPSWRDEFVWSGTRDPSAYLAIAAAIDFLESVGLDAFRKRVHSLACYARGRLVALTGQEPLLPDTPAWYGSMISLPLAPLASQPTVGLQVDPLQDALWRKHGIEVPVFCWKGRRFLRVSCHLYTSRAHIDRLADALGLLL